jgi:conserved oligomeric Golgi complex subunit 6
MVTDLNRSCDEMRKQILTARQESAPMLEEASTLTAQKQEVETKEQLLNAFNKHFVLSDEDLTVLTNSTEQVDSRFFEVLNRVKQIHKDCEVLLGSEDQTLGIELMEQTSRNLNAAFKKLYNWIQREFKALDLEDPRISATIRKALRVLAERPTLFENCLDFFAEARERTLSDAFHAALTDTVNGATTTGTSFKPIEFSTHDLLRYVGDMLAWVHSTAVSEKEALEGLFISNGDEIAKEIQAGRDKEPWSRLQNENEDEEKTMPIFDGRKALNELVNRDLEGVSRTVKQRIEVANQSNDDPLLIYKALNSLKFYQDIFSKLVGTESTLCNVMTELQTSTFSHFERLMQDEVSAAANEALPDDLSAPSFLIQALERFQSYMHTGAETSETEISRLLSASIVSFLDQCSELSNTVVERPSQTIFQLNYFLAVDSSLRPILPTNHSFLTAATKKINELHEELTEAQNDFLLHKSGVGLLLDSINSVEGEENSAQRDISTLPALTPGKLSASAAHLDDFLPSALMDVLDNMKQLSDKSLAKRIAQEAAERFCADFERVEDAILCADELLFERRRERDEMEDREVEDEDEEPLLRDVYPRTTAEIRVLLS